ncbi:hypothetical protein HY489_00255 [Candidatus Woesearchaeota archaeon]|nr:hypothetical protein [Candidatus Woesearchaeota archaeon]
MSEMTLQEILNSETERCPFLADIDLSQREYNFVRRALRQHEPKESAFDKKYLGDPKDTCKEKKLTTRTEDTPLDKERRKLALGWAHYRLREFYENPTKFSRDTVEEEVGNYLRMAEEEVDNLGDVMSALYALSVHRAVRMFEREIRLAPQQTQTIMARYCKKNMPEVTDYVLASMSVPV